MEKKQEQFPISKTKSIKGFRRLVREKVMQILVSHFVSGTDIELLFEHIFYREFHIENEQNDETVEQTERLLTRNEIAEMLADTAIEWNNKCINFGKELIDYCVKNQEYVVEMLKIISENWNFERVAIIDRAIIIIGTTEMLNFPDIPVKVTINEAIELAKKFSSDKSHIFVNGILEKMKKQLEKENKIVKSERGKINK